MPLSEVKTPLLSRSPDPSHSYKFIEGDEVEDKEVSESDRHQLDSFSSDGDEENDLRDTVSTTRFQIPSLSGEHMPLFLANTLQLADFQLSDDIIHAPTRPPKCDRKEIVASSSWKKQIFSLSTLICVVQVSSLRVLSSLLKFRHTFH